MTGFFKDQDEILVRIEGSVGRLTLNRPKALHALTDRMCGLMVDALLTWLDNPRVKLVLIDHAGDRGFRAGGDIRMLAQSGAGDGAEARAFFHLEYRLNHLSLGAAARSFADNMTMEYRIGARVVRSHDFLKGVRAVIVEKDNLPRWRPETLQDVTPAQLNQIFAPLEASAEWTPLSGAFA